MTLPEDRKRCLACKDGSQLPFSFSMAFQPIVDVRESRVFAYEALARGVAGEPAATILSQVTDANRYAFDQACRVKAIALASHLKLPASGAKLSINFLPGAVYSPAACIQLTLNTAREHRFPLDSLIFEVVESEEIANRDQLRAIFREYRSHGFKMAVDDFGSGYAGVNAFLDLAPEELKLDMAIVRGIENRPLARSFVKMMAEVCAAHEIALVAEGVETMAEYETLVGCGIRLMQGYLLARPAFEALPKFFLPAREEAA